MPEEVDPVSPPPLKASSPEVKKPINWKLIGIIVVIAAIVIGGLGYATVVLNIFDKSKEEPTQTTTTPKTATPSTTPKEKEEPKDETAGWKTYTVNYPNNSEVINSVTFKYPPDWVEFKSRSEIHNPTLAKHDGTKETVDSGEAKIQYNGITPTKNFSPRPESLKEFIEVSNGMPTAKKTKQKVSGREAYLVEGEFVRLLYIDLGNTDNILYISFQGNPVADFEKTFQLVISTISIK